MLSNSGIALVWHYLNSTRYLHFDTAWISSRKSAIENEKPDFEGEKLAIEGEKTSSGHQKVAIERIYELCKEQNYNRPTLETVVSLSLKKDSPKIEISMKPGEDSLYEPQDKGTYEKIKAYVLEKYGFKVSSLYIAQTKDKCGLDKRLNYNLSKKDDPHVPECPKEKKDAIMDAFRHFGLIE